MCTFGSLVLYLVLTWYFDHIISSNRGVASPFYFPFTKKYWFSFFCDNQQSNQQIKVKQKKRKVSLEEYTDTKEKL
jgi:hypothetical protein